LLQHIQEIGVVICQGSALEDPRLICQLVGVQSVSLAMALHLARCQHDELPVTVCHRRRDHCQTSVAAGE
jgi:hypothetical protein